MTQTKRAFWTDAHDDFLRTHGATQTCDWIAERLHRSRSAVHGRAKRLGVNMTKRGTAHWNAKADAELPAMVGALVDAGYRATQVHALLSKQHNLSVQTIHDMAAGRTWS